MAMRVPFWSLWTGSPRISHKASTWHTRHAIRSATAKGDRERNGTGLCVHGWLDGQEPAEADAEHVDVVAVALGGDDQLAAVRGEGDLPGGGGERNSSR